MSCREGCRRVACTAVIAGAVAVAVPAQKVAVAGATICVVASARCPVGSAANKKAAARLRKRGGKHGGAQTHQLPSQLVASRRRSRAPSTSPVIGDSCGSPVIASIVDKPDIAISGASLCGSSQPLAVESMARRTSTRPIVLGEEDVPRNPRIASATGTAATVASRVPRSFGHAPRPFERCAKALLASCAATG